MYIHNGNKYIELFLAVFTQYGSHKDPLPLCIHYYTEDKKIDGYFECSIDEFNDEHKVSVSYLRNDYEDCPLSILTKSQLEEVNTFMHDGNNFEKLNDAWYDCVPDSCKKEIPKHRSFWYKNGSIQIPDFSKINSTLFTTKEKKHLQNVYSHILDFGCSDYRIKNTPEGRIYKNGKLTYKTITFSSLCYRADQNINYECSVCIYDIYDDVDNVEDILLFVIPICKTSRMNILKEKLKSRKFKKKYLDKKKYIEDYMESRNSYLEDFNDSLCLPKKYEYLW